MSLRRTVAWTAAGNGVYLGCQYAMLMVLAKLGSPGLVGQFSLALAVTAPVVIISQMQLRQLIVTDVRTEYRFADYFLARLFAGGIALVAISGVVVISGYPSETKSVICLMGLAKVLESLSDIVHGHLQRVERMDCVAVSLIAKGTTSVVAFGAALWYGQRLVGAVTALTAVWATILVALDAPMLYRASKPSLRVLSWRLEAVGRLVATALALGLASGLSSVSANVPRYFLEGLHGDKVLGFFAVAAAPLTLLNLFTGAVSQATLARTAWYFQTGQTRAFHRLTVRIMLAQVVIAGAGTVFFALFGGLVLRVLFTAEYVASAPVLVTMAAGITVGGLAGFGSTVLSAGRMFRLQLLNVAVMVLAQIPVCYYLIAGWGVSGAGWAEFVRYTLATAFLHLVGLRAFRLHIGGRA